MLTGVCGNRASLCGAICARASSNSWTRFQVSRLTDASYATIWVVYSCLSVSPDQEQQVCDALINLGWLENDHALHAEGVRVVRELLVCSADDAKAVLHDLRSRKLIDVTITPGGQLDTRKPMPVAQLRWVRPRV